MKKVLFIFGTRPEVIKLAPVILRMRQFPDEFQICICNTAQHRNIIQEPIDLFGLNVDIDLDIMRPNQDLFDITQRLIASFKNRVLTEFSPDLVVVQGDTTTTMAGSLCSFYAGVPVVHVEAGLRTNRLDSPFPEEFNRRVCSIIANRHYCPTEWARNNLLLENVPDENISVTGNTSIDSIFWLLKTYERPDEKYPFNSEAGLEHATKVLITLHRRENFGVPFQNILEAIKTLSIKYPSTHWIYPVHPNPNIRIPAHENLSSLPNVHLINPMDYLNFIFLMKSSDLIITDSGGVQEEAPSLGKPVLVVRNTTERPEGVQAGTAKLVGVDKNKIIESASLLLDDSVAYQKMAQVRNPYGDGRAAERIVDDLMKY